MISSLFLGIASGFVLSIPPGPLSAAVTKHSVHHSFRFGLMIALGGAVMDIVYVLLAAFASSAIVVALIDLVTGNGWVLLSFQAVCILVLIVMGIRYMRTTRKSTDESRYLSVEQAQEEKARRLGYSSPFFVGVMIAIANLASPTFLPSMVSVVSYAQANGLIERTATANVTYAVGFGVGTALWFSLVASLLARHRSRLSAAVLDNIYRFAGITFIICAFILTYNVIMSTDWTALR